MRVVFRFAGVEPALVFHDGADRALHVARARWHVQVLDVLERIARRADHQALQHDRIEIDEDVVAKEFVDLEFTRAVLAHEAAERRLLVRRIVIDVARAIREPARIGPVDERFEGALLLCVVVGPPVAEHRRAGIHRDDAEEVFEARGREWEAFDVEEHVVR